MWFLTVMVVVTLVILWMIKWVYMWMNPRCINGKLPPGSMGLPLLGESIQFFKPESSFDIHPFIKNRVKRYGKLFKTSLVGCPVIVSTDPDISHFIFQEEGNSLELWYSDSFMRLIGQNKLTTSTGAIHKYLRNMIMDQFGPEKQKEKVLLEIEDMARTNLNIWSKQQSVEVKEAATTVH
ncbi:Cytochrome p450 [Thalictrum thalictroides]|uniref:Cytochrome p450 n=1 Tax=Thalictrum thalictroides TaxID=46969 RepID=A0A7J6WJP6_THATH|nr:Cytochrome p450 [Thalictrum thalictroides]